MSKTVYAPIYSTAEKDGLDIFLAGSIEMGKADNWQPRVTSEIEDMPEVGRIFNPRRLDFQAEAEQSIRNPYFKEQVDWELDHLDKADIVFMYLDPKSKSPISLMELGLLANDVKLIVCCPDGFWRKGNVEIVCYRAGIPLLHDLESGIAALKFIIKH